MHSYRWSDLEFVFAVASAGSVAAAARRLKVDHTTVLRRVHNFEKTVHIQIFERLRTGYRPTPEGEIFLDAARSIESTVSELNRKIAGSEAALKGPLSITSTDSIVPMFMDEVAAFGRQNPEVVIDIRVANVHLNLDQRESDIAVRASSNPAEHLVGRKACDLRFGIYTADEAASALSLMQLKSEKWLGTVGPLGGSVAGEWMHQMIPKSQLVGCSDSFNTLRDMAENGLGIAMLPRHVGDPSKRLTRIPDPGKMPVAGIWLLSHKDILRSPRVRSAAEFLFKGLRSKRALFEGGSVA